MPQYNISNKVYNKIYKYGCVKYILSHNDPSYATGKYAVVTSGITDGINIAFKNKLNPNIIKQINPPLKK